MSALVDCRQVQRLVHRRVASHKSPAPQCVAGATLTCKALIDRVTDRAHIITTGTDSYRFRRTTAQRKAAKP
jgi:hypothetical protein